MRSPMDPPEVAIDVGHCPLCGADNRCAMAAPRSGPPAAVPETCWCQVTAIAPGVLERLPAALRGQACICARCAQG